jgi:RHS repeat-associated protein
MSYTNSRSGWVRLSTGTIVYLVADSLGSVRGAVASSGSLSGSVDYDAWGNPETAGGLSSYTPFGFAGAYTDPSGMVYLIGRYYDPQTGQFLSVDPLVRQTKQPYLYAADNPVKYSDPTGLTWYLWTEQWLESGSVWTARGSVRSRSGYSTEAMIEVTGASSTPLYAVINDNDPGSTLHRYHGGNAPFENGYNSVGDASSITANITNYTFITEVINKFAYAKGELGNTLTLNLTFSIEGYVGIYLFGFLVPGLARLDIFHN